MIVFIGYVWTEAVSVKKTLRFQMKTDTCGQDLSLKKTRRFYLGWIYYSIC